MTNDEAQAILNSIMAAPGPDYFIPVEAARTLGDWLSEGGADFFYDLDCHSMHWCAPGVTPALDEDGPEVIVDSILEYVGGIPHVPVIIVGSRDPEEVILTFEGAYLTLW